MVPDSVLSDCFTNFALELITVLWKGNLLEKKKNSNKILREQS